jgi:hypothetical protein
MTTPGTASTPTENFIEICDPKTLFRSDRGTTAGAGRNHNKTKEKLK